MSVKSVSGFQLVSFSESGKRKDPFLSLESLHALDHDYSVNSKPYILSNECNREETLKVLSRAASSEGAFHIGFSCWENYDFMVARNSCGALIADISNETSKFHQLTQKLILSSSNREKFVACMLEFLSADSSFLREETAEALDAIHKELFRSGSWLNTDEAFENIQSLYRNQRIIHIRMNLKDIKAFQAVADWMRANGLYCDSLYLSNIPDWIQNGESPDREMGKLKFAINRVLCKASYVIHASEFFHENTGMPQRVYQGSPYDPARSMRESKKSE
jgi:hypothetical protein